MKKLVTIILKTSQEGNKIESNTEKKYIMKLHMIRTNVRVNQRNI